MLVQRGDWTDAQAREDQTRWCVGVTVDVKAGKLLVAEGAEQGRQGADLSRQHSYAAGRDRRDTLRYRGAV
jgi:hypothetical protein